MQHDKTSSMFMFHFHARMSVVGPGVLLYAGGYGGVRCSRRRGPEGNATRGGRALGEGKVVWLGFFLSQVFVTAGTVRSRLIDRFDLVLLMLERARLPVRWKNEKEKVPCALKKRCICYCFSDLVGVQEDDSIRRCRPPMGCKAFGLFVRVGVSPDEAAVSWFLVLLALVSRSLACYHLGVLSCPVLACPVHASSPP